MRLEIDIPDHHYNNIMALDTVSLGRVPYKGIIMYAINAIKRGRVLEQEPVLDKIRAEIEEKADGSVGEIADGLYDALEIIDKYKAESEE